jgi:hypothetical protein
MNAEMDISKNQWRSTGGVIYSNSESSEQFLETNAFLTCSWRFLISNKLEQLEFKLKKKYWDLETCRKS